MWNEYSTERLILLQVMWIYDPVLFFLMRILHWTVLRPTLSMLQARMKNTFHLPEIICASNTISSGSKFKITPEGGGGVKESEGSDTNRNFWSLLESSLCWLLCSEEVTGGVSVLSSSSKGPEPSLSSAGHSSLLSLLPFLWNLNEKLLRNFCSTLSCWLCARCAAFWLPPVGTLATFRTEDGSCNLEWLTRGIVASAKGCSVVTWWPLLVPSSSSSPDHCRLQPEFSVSPFYSPFGKVSQMRLIDGNSVFITRNFQSSLSGIDSGIIEFVSVLVQLCVDSF